MPNTSFECVDNVIFAAYLSPEYEEKREKRIKDLTEGGIVFGSTIRGIFSPKQPIKKYTKEGMEKLKPAF